MDWDLNALMERLEGDREFLRELLTIFQQDVRSNLEKSQTALAGDRLIELSRAAHTLKGMLKNLSMGDAAQTAAALTLRIMPPTERPRTLFFLTINKAKFRKPVHPGDTLEYHVEKLAQRRNMYWYRCQAKVGGALVAQAELGAYLEADS